MKAELLKPNTENININNHEDVFQLLFQENDITWKSVLLELVRQEKMDPWDIDVSLLTGKYIGVVEKLQEMDFRVSGKVLLAASILLRLKSTRLVEDDITKLDSMISATEEVDEDSFYEELEAEMRHAGQLTPEQKIGLIPRVPQPRKRKVSIYDLVSALDKALEVKRRRIIGTIPTGNIVPPPKTVNISEAIKRVYGKIVQMLDIGAKDRLLFTHLIPSDSKEDKVLTFIPLLHLSNQKKIQLNQEVAFGDIEVLLRKKMEADLTKQVDKEIS